MNIFPLKLRDLALIISFVLFSSCEKQSIQNPSNTIDYLNLNDPLKEVKYISLTFDDGPDNIYTPLILDVLKEKNVVATFFLIGNKMKKYPEITKRIFNEGHVLANHTTNHLRLPGKSFSQVLDNLIQTEKIIASVCGTSQKLYRPPFGLITNNQKERLSRLGFKIVLWNVNSKDFVRTESIEDIVNNIVNGAGNNKVVLFHSADFEDKASRMNTVLALPRIIDKLRSENYIFVKVK
jgi:peptidoglycan-N-acetylglucosamine deacetylase